MGMGSNGDMSMQAAAAPEIQKAESQPLADATEDATPKKQPQTFLGRSIDVWLSLITQFPMIYFFIIIAMNFDGCPDIPGLNYCATIVNAYNVLLGVWKVCFKIPLMGDSNRKDWSMQVANFGSLPQLGFAIWAAVITWPNAGPVFSQKKDCNLEVFNSAFIASLITMAIFAVMLVAGFGYLIYYLACKRGGATTEHNEAEGAVADAMV